MDSVKTYRLKNSRELWLLMIVPVVGIFSWLAIKLFQSSGLAVQAIFILLFIGVILIFYVVYWHDMLIDRFLEISKEGFVFHDMWGTMTFKWDNAIYIKKSFILGQQIVFKGQPTYSRNPKWSWFEQPDRWPIIGKLRLTGTIALDNWINKDDLIQEIRRYAPQVFENEARRK
jgi:hypothetical protein